MQFLPLCTSCLFSWPVNDDIVGIEKPYEICSLTFFVDDFSGLYLHVPVFTIQDSKSA